MSTDTKVPAEKTEDVPKCPICDDPFSADDNCATDIEMGTCHAECLEGSPVVDLETGEETGGKVDTYRYSEVMDPPPPAQKKRRPQQMYLKGFRQARDLAIQVVESVDTNDHSLLTNAIRAIHPPTKIRHKPEDKL